jgi:hypothetical protein
VDDYNVLRPGDSGSGVVDVGTAELLGHIVSAHLGTHIAYVTPMHDIMEDINKQSTKKPSDPSPIISKRKAIKLEFRSWPWRPQRTWTDSHHETEFSSPKFLQARAGPRHAKTTPYEGVLRLCDGDACPIEIT